MTKTTTTMKMGFDTIEINLVVVIVNLLCASKGTKLKVQEEQTLKDNFISVLKKIYDVLRIIQNSDIINY